jgi:hypothetical protein
MGKITKGEGELRKERTKTGGTENQEGGIGKRCKRAPG